MDSDGELTRRVLEGEEGAVTELVRTYQNLVRRIVFRIVRDPRDREEVCQDSFLKALRSLRSFRREARLGTWIGRIAYREAIQYLRRCQHTPENALGATDDLLSDAPSSHAALERRELQDLVARAIDRLTPAQKTAITLFHLEEMSLAEIASVIGAPVNTVKSHLLRARQILRELLKEEGQARGYAP